MEPHPRSVDNTRQSTPIINDGLQVAEPQERNEEHSPLDLAGYRQADNPARFAEFVCDGLQVQPQERCMEQPPLQVAFNPQEKAVVCISPHLQLGLHNADDGQGHHERLGGTPRIQKRTRRCIGMITLIIAFILIAILTPVLIHKHRRSNSNQSLPAAVNPVSSTTETPVSSKTETLVSSTIRTLISNPTGYPSTTGAFNGTGLVAINPIRRIDKVMLVFQHYTGDIRSNRLSNSGVWRGVESLGLQNVMNGSSLAGTSYEINNVLSLQLFYVDGSGVIQNAVWTNLSAAWNPGSLGSFRYQAPQKPGSGLLVTFDLISDGSGADMRLYAGGAHGLVQEYAYTHVNDSWAVGFTFPSTNGFAGISGAWFPYLLTQAILVVTNANGELELWWKDTDPRATGNATHPVGEWVRGSYSTGGLSPNTSVCYSGFAYYQDENGEVLGITTSGIAEAQRWGSTIIVDGVKTLYGTSITCELGWNPGDHVYFQGNGSSILACDRADSDSPWTITVVPLG